MHAFLALLLVCFLRPPAPGLDPADKSSRRLVWTAGFGGGGRGGDGLKAAPAAPSPKPARASAQFQIPSTPTVSPMLQLPGVVAILTAADGAGPGTDDGEGKGKGSGKDGPGTGTQPGPGPGAGEGPLPAGTPGVTSPQVIFEKTPEYTLDAMRARIQGPVLVEAVVLTDGSVGAVRVLRSLDHQLGLDQKAIEAVRQWRFRPGTRFGKPAAVLVLIELTFRLH